ncbi:hypothetical protein [Tenacibaculum sp. Bg11-29]|uniref:hypothetical protein n=1 Tax=Tenacibaculum sp. Bg11-29 TaxID=2058306 RepID=UPI0018E38940|nr:hypothetical protein [Tenacibaculum sp. Bg11-29]
MKDVFPTQKNTDSTFVFSIDTIEKIRNNKYCKEIEYKNQFIRTNLNDLPINLFFVVFCRSLTFCPKSKNIIDIKYNFKRDTTYFNHNYDLSRVLEVTNFSELLNKQFLNRGKKLEYADSPDKCIIYLDYHDLTKKSTEKLSNSLDTISISYFNFIKKFQKQNIDSLKNEYPLQILLLTDYKPFENFIFPKLPPPPAPL